MNERAEALPDGFCDRESKFPPVPVLLRSRNPLHYLRFFGPGAVLASVTIGSGETVFASRGGAVFGYTLLWCFLLGTIFKAVQVYSSTRAMTLTGYHPVALWTRMPGPRGWFPAFLMMVAIVIVPGSFSALSRFLGTLLSRLAGVAPSSENWVLAVNLFSSLTLLAAAGLALRSSYAFLELVQTAIVLFFLGFVLLSFALFHPPFLELVGSFIVPRLPSYPDWVVSRYPEVAARPRWVEVMTYIGVIGGSSSDYLGYLSFFREKGWGRITRPVAWSQALEDFNERDLRRAREWLRAPLIDLLLSFGSVLLFSTVFVVLGAVLLGSAHLVPHDSEILTVQARFLTSVHEGFYWIYVLGIAVVFLGTIYGGMEIQTRALYECLGAFRSTAAGISLRRFRPLFIIFVTLTALILIWTGWDPVALFTPASILGGVFACGLWCFAMLWVDRRCLPPPLQMPSWSRGLLVISGIALTGLGVRALLDYFMDW